VKIAAFTFVVITESSRYSPVPSDVRVEPHPRADANRTVVRRRAANRLNDVMAILLMMMNSYYSNSLGLP
jgi:hypothetical protein